MIRVLVFMNPVLLDIPQMGARGRRLPSGNYSNSSTSLRSQLLPRGLFGLGLGEFGLYGLRERGLIATHGRRPRVIHDGGGQ
jgi:hypothetical protein